MRELVDHKINEANEQLRVVAVDKPGPGNASHHYSITGFRLSENPSRPIRQEHEPSPTQCVIVFQNGPIKESGVNGVTGEALLAILIDRLRGFQTGNYACRENALALTKLEEAAHWLHHRTRTRVARGVEGTHLI